MNGNRTASRLCWGSVLFPACRSLLEAFMNAMRTWVCRGVAIVAIAIGVLGFARSAAAQATGTVAGTVKDAQGGVIPGATITLLSETRGTSIVAVTNSSGDFVVPNIPGDIYTVKVSIDGFKASERKNVNVTPGDRVALGTVTLEQGAFEETVVVTSQTPLIQAQTGERSFTVSRESVENLPVSGRNFASFATLTPGVLAQGSTAVRADGARTNYILDGISSVNTGGNQQGLQVNPDAIAEVKVVATAYQAEYGRTSGLQIAGVTKSGSNQFSGSTFDIERHSAWDTNSWANQKNNLPKTKSDQRDWGYTIGGPVGRAGGSNKLFFFYSEQFQPRSSGGAVNDFRVPTALERKGDFSQTTDQNGALLNLIRDASTGLPCTSTNTAGCFQDGGVLGRLPQNRLYGLGLNILNLYPDANGSDVTGRNFHAVTPITSSDTFLHVIRVDYQASSKLRVSAKYAGQNATVQTNPGSMPGYNDTIFQFPAILVPSATVVYVVNKTTVFEGTWGLTQGNQLGNEPNSPLTNRNAAGLGNFPTLFPNNGLVPVGSFQEKVLKAMNAPFYVDGQLQMRPQFSWGNRISGAPPNSPYPGFVCDQNTKDLSLSLTKLWAAHTFKFGYVSQDSLKRQNVGTQVGVLPVEGSVNFGNDSNNPLDTGFGFSNAALGVFSSFAQMDKFLEGHYVYHNKDFYAQDNWKVNGKLTLDYGMRFTHHGQQYDTYLQGSNFFPDKWSASQAPQLYQPGCLNGGSGPCTTANPLVAINPITGASLGLGSGVSVGTIVPGSGVVANGFIQQGQGIVKENYKEPALALGPRFGGAYDIRGDQKVVVRGSLGVFYDRLQGDSIFGQSGNPPGSVQATLVNSTLQDVAAGAQGLQSPPKSTVYYYDAKLGSSLNYNVGVQMALPFTSSLDVSYVGSHNYNSVAFGAISTPGGQVAIDFNAPDIGTAYLPQYQDPTKPASAIPGQQAYVTDLLRPYRGLGAITVTWPRFHTQYDSIQTSFNRRFRHGWQAGLNWTLGLRFTGNTLSPIHLEHNADGTIGVASDQAERDALLSNVGLRRHIVKANFIWDLPNVRGSGGAWMVMRAALSDWQLSGVFTGGSGTPYDATFSYTSGGSNVNLTGSPNYTARIKVVGDPGKGCSSNQYAQFDVNAFQGPGYHSTGNESGTNILSGCPDHTLDLALQRNIKLGGKRQIQFRLDAFNVLNVVVYSARVTGIQYKSPADPITISNNEYNADGSINTARLTPNTAGAGAVTGAQPMRTMQLQIRYTF
jgi:hypothetical protein